MIVDLIAEFLADGRDGTGVLHATVVGITGGDKLFVRMNFVVVEELVT